MIQNNFAKDGFILKKNLFTEEEINKQAWIKYAKTNLVRQRSSASDTSESQISSRSCQSVPSDRVFINSRDATKSRGSSSHGSRSNVDVRIQVGNTELLE